MLSHPGKRFATATAKAKGRLSCRPSTACRWLQARDYRRAKVATVRAHALNARVVYWSTGGWFCVRRARVITVASEKVDGKLCHTAVMKDDGLIVAWLPSPHKLGTVVGCG